MPRNQSRRVETFGKSILSRDLDSITSIPSLVSGDSMLEYYYGNGASVFQRIPLAAKHYSLIVKLYKLHEKFGSYVDTFVKSLMHQGHSALASIEKIAVKLEKAINSNQLEYALNLLKIVVPGLAVYAMQKLEHVPFVKADQAIGKIGGILAVSTLDNANSSPDKVSVIAIKHLVQADQDKVVEPQDTLIPQGFNVEDGARSFLIPEYQLQFFTPFGISPDAQVVGAVGVATTSEAPEVSTDESSVSDGISEEAQSDVADSETDEGTVFVHELGEDNTRALVLEESVAILPEVVGTDQETFVVAVEELDEKTVVRNSVDTSVADVATFDVSIFGEVCDTIYGDELC